MSENRFTEGVKPGGLTSGTEIKILICYLLDNVPGPVSRADIENVLLGEELANYFVIADSLSLLKQQGMIGGNDDGYIVSEAGRMVGKTLAQDVPKSVRDTAVRGVIRAQQFAAKAGTNQSDILPLPQGFNVSCKINDASGPLFSMELYAPDELSAQMLRKKFILEGENIYKLVLAALTENPQMAKDALQNIK